MFYTESDNYIPIVPIFDIVSLFAAEFEEPKIGISGEGLKSFSNRQEACRLVSAIQLQVSVHCIGTYNSIALTS